MLDFISPWADLIVGLGNIACSIGVIPTLRHGLKHQDVPYGTSVVLAVALGVIGLALLSQGLVFGFASTVCGGLLWAGVAGERAWQGHRARRAS